MGCIVPLIAVPDVIATGFIKQPKQLPAIQADDELLDEVKHVIRSLSVEEPIIRLVIYIVMILGHSNPLPLLEKSDGGSYTWSMHSTNKSKPKRCAVLTMRMVWLVLKSPGPRNFHIPLAAGYDFEFTYISA